MEEAVDNSVPYQEISNPKKEAYETSSDDSDFGDFKLEKQLAQVSKGRFKGHKKNNRNSGMFLPWELNQDSSSGSKQNGSKKYSTSGYNILADEVTLSKFRSILELQEMLNACEYERLTVGEELLIIFLFAQHRDKSFTSNLREISSLINRNQEEIRQQIPDFKYFQRFTHSITRLIHANLKRDPQATLIKCISWREMGFKRYELELVSNPLRGQKIKDKDLIMLNSSRVNQRQYQEQQFLSQDRLQDSEEQLINKEHTSLIQSSNIQQLESQRVYHNYHGLLKGQNLLNQEKVYLDSEENNDRNLSYKYSNDKVDIIGEEEEDIQSA